MLSLKICKHKNWKTFTKTKNSRGTIKRICEKYVTQICHGPTYGREYEKEYKNIKSQTAFCQTKFGESYWNLFS